MARVARIEEGHQNIRPHDSKVDCFIQTVIADDGETLVHLSTFGSAYRQSAPKSSQSMQFDLETARQVVDHFVSAFGPVVVRSR